jgi:arsenate reductase (thioredoxin)
VGKFQKPNVLFLCTGNSCRSQMAQAWGENLLGDKYFFFSAGTSPHPIAENTKIAMQEVGIDISDYYPKSPHELGNIKFDYAITLCDNARENCPVLPGNAVMIHQSFPDPFNAQGTKAEILKTYRKVRDEIKKFVLTLPKICR